MTGDVVLAYWPGWLSGLLLAAVIVCYFWLTGRLLSSSGRVSVVIDRVRQRGATECGPVSTDASLQELAEALRLASIETFGERAVQDSLARQSTRHEQKPVKLRPRASISWVGHLLFLIGMVLGGRVSHWQAPVRWTLGEGVWADTVPAGALPYLLLFAGILVGFGTRMAGGCPVGHGLCGMPRAQAGSWVASLAFFGAGVGVSFMVGWL